MPPTTTESTVSLTPAEIAPIAAVVNQAKTESAVTASVAGEAHFAAQGNASPTLGASLGGPLGAIAGLVNGAQPVKPAALPTQLGTWNTGSITFNNGVPVGATNMSLTLNQNGSYNFQGHFHDSGATSYNGEATWIIATAKGVALSFSQSGHMAGTFESGSRNWIFNVSGNNAAITAHWADLCASYHWRWQVAINLDLGSLLSSVENALEQVVGVALQVVAIVS